MLRRLIARVTGGVGRPRTDQEELAPRRLYLVGGLTLFCYPLGAFVNPFWITVGALLATVTVSRDAFRLVYVRDADWRWGYVYPFLFVVGFPVYTPLLVVYLYHRRRPVARVADTSYEAVQSVREDMDVPRPRAIYALLGYDVLVQIVLLGSTSGLLFVGSGLLYAVGIPIHGLYVSRDLGDLGEAGVRWGRWSALLHAGAGLAIVFVLVYLFQRSEHVYYSALAGPETDDDDDEVPPGTERRDFDVHANRADMLNSE